MLAVFKIRLKRPDTNWLAAVISVSALHNQS